VKEVLTNHNSNSKQITGTKEWATKNVNIYNGCPNDCKYCYAKSNAIRFGRKTSENWKDLELNERNYNKGYTKRDGRIMFPSSHDIAPENLNHYKSTLLKLVSAGNSVLVVSKPVFECIKSICDDFAEYKDKILFRFTITSKNDDTLNFWEPNAPSYEERLRSLQYAFNNHFQTSVSCEPYLDDSIIELIEVIKPFVTDSIWIGKANRLKAILGINKHTDELTQRMANELLQLYESRYSQRLFDTFRNDSLIKWKESLKKEFNIPLATESGLDQ
jgi:DNA repair photolyase